MINFVADVGVELEVQLRLMVVFLVLWASSLVFVGHHSTGQTQSLTQ